MKKRKTFLFVNFKGDIGVNVSRIPHLQLGGRYKRLVIPPRIARRNTRGPLLFKCVRLEYDEETNRLYLPDGVIVGKNVTNRDVGDEEEGKENEEYANTAMGAEDENSVVAGMIFNNYSTVGYEKIVANVARSACWLESFGTKQFY